MVPDASLDHVYLYHYLSANVEALNNLGTGATFKELSASTLRGFPIPLPPPEEQMRIVAVLDEAFERLDRARANAEANLADARDLFAVQVEALIRSSGGEAITLEKLIESGAILSHFDGNHGENYPRKEEFTGVGVPYLSANCLVDNEVDFSRAKFLPDGRADTLRKGTSKDRDILFAHNATVGPVALLRTDLPRVLLSTSLTHYRCNEEVIIPEFLLVEMQSAAFVRQYETVMRQATRNQVPISAQRKFTHILPPLKEQTRIAAISTQLREDVSALVPPEGDPPEPRGPSGGPEVPPEPPEGGEPGGGDEPKPKLIIRLADGKERAITYLAATSYWGPDGKPMSAQQFLDRLFGDLSGLIADEDDLRRKWSDPESREHFVALLEQRGYDAEKLADMRRLVDAPNSDLFDVLGYIRFTTPPKTRADRAESVRHDGMGTDDEKMRAFLLGVLQAYEALGESELATRKLSDFLTARYGSIADAKAALGDVPKIRKAFVDVQRDLYRQ